MIRYVCGKPQVPGRVLSAIENAARETGDVELGLRQAGVIIRQTQFNVFVRDLRAPTKSYITEGEEEVVVRSEKAGTLGENPGTLERELARSKDGGIPGAIGGLGSRMSFA
ncbi:hypothetical protein NMY22_g16183 [Coprinellus aureogranulatus]|nr:hypothetical protein NMY22_g16183 [Coprinellus aureogranulatus]